MPSPYAISKDEDKIMPSMTSILADYSDQPACLALVAPCAAPLCGANNGDWWHFSVAGDVYDLARAVAWLDATGLLNSRWRAICDGDVGFDLLVCND